ncbi:MAG TPA: flagellar basal body rod protein FlgB [Alphaproteobacteria bacterium]
MNLGKLPLFELISRRMTWLTERQKVIAENIANADTPNYQARDLKPMSRRGFAAVLERLRPAVTDARHIAGGTRGGMKADVVKSKASETTLSGNAVSLETELMKVAETATDYQLVTNLYRKQIGMLKMVVGRGPS